MRGPSASLSGQPFSRHPPVLEAAFNGTPT